ncbi:MAG: ABC transporter permease [Acidobacteria bacterium]|nr:MAG: ABC transporter permease [Acidobacteriota bacterium]
MKERFGSIFSARFWPLALKELRQIARNRRLLVSLVIPPTLQLILFGFALNPQVTHLRLGVVDASRTAESRELVSAFVESQSFEVTGQFASVDEMGAALSRGDLDVGLVIPVDYARKRAWHITAEVQLLFDAVNSNTAAIASGYAGRVINALNQKIARATPPPVMEQPTPTPATSATDAPSADAQNQSAQGQTATAQITSTTSTAPAVTLNVAQSPLARASVTPHITLLYNPGLLNSWFIVTGTLGTLLVLNGSIVASASMVREKEIGTIEQLLMTPAEASEIITAKIAPLFLLLCGDVLLAITVGRVVFGVPVRGSMILLFCAGALCVLAGIGIGTMLATFTRSQQQAQLMAFFVNPPLAMLAGATTPLEGMPKWLQQFTLINPIRHFAMISRGVMLKGTGLSELYPNFLALLAFAVLLVGISAWRFRKQLG